MPDDYPSNDPSAGAAPTSDYAASPPIQDIAAWRAQYRVTAEELERLRTVELATMTEAEAFRQRQLLSVCETPWRERPDWSGLVEQQAILHRKRKS